MSTRTTRTFHSFCCSSFLSIHMSWCCWCVLAYFFRFQLGKLCQITPKIAQFSGERKRRKKRKRRVKVSSRAGQSEVTKNVENSTAPLNFLVGIATASDAIIIAVICFASLPAELCIILYYYFSLSLSLSFSLTEKIHSNWICTDKALGEAPWSHRTNLWIYK